MEIKSFTGAEMQYLSKFESQFSCVLDSNFLRSAAQSDLEQIKGIWERVTDTDYRLVKDCGQCQFDLLKRVGMAYRKQIAEQKTETTIKPKRTNGNRKTTTQKH